MLGIAMNQNKANWGERVVGQVCRYFQNDLKEACLGDFCVEIWTKRLNETIQSTEIKEVNDNFNRGKQWVAFQQECNGSDWNKQFKCKIEIVLRFLFFKVLSWDQKNISVKNQIVNISVFVGPIWCSSYLLNSVIVLGKQL